MSQAGYQQPQQQTSGGNWGSWNLNQQTGAGGQQNWQQWSGGSTQPTSTGHWKGFSNSNQSTNQQSSANASYSTSTQPQQQNWSFWQQVRDIL